MAQVSGGERGAGYPRWVSLADRARMRADHPFPDRAIEELVLYHTDAVARERDGRHRRSCGKGKGDS